jgi:hypothetical protein
MGRRLLLISFGVLLLGGVAWFVVGSVARDTAGAVASQRGEPARRAAPAELEAPIALPASAAIPAEREAVVAETPASEGPAPPNDEPTDEVLVTGTIVVVDEAGVEHAREAGDLQVSAWSVTDSVVQADPAMRVQVESGAFEFRVRADAELSIRDVHLHGKLAVLEGESDVERVPDDRRLHLHAIWLRPMRVVVRAADTGRELTAIQGVEVEAGRREVPSSAEVPLELGDSPVTLRPTQVDWNRLRAFFLRAPGYAWQIVEVDLAAGGERVVDLVPGGALEVEVDGALPQVKTHLRVRPVERPWWCEAEIEIGSTPATHRIDSLPPDRKRVSIEHGPDHNPEPMTSAEVELVAGATVSLRLDLDAAPARELVPLAGTLRLPASWGFTPDAFHIRAAEPKEGRWHHVPDRGVFQRIDGTEDLWSWSVAPVEPGAYVIFLGGTGWSVLADVPLAGRTDVHIEVPPPADVEVVVVERTSGAGAAVEDVLWNVVRPARVRLTSHEVAGWSSDVGVWTFRAPQGAIELQVLDDAYEPASQRVQALPGANRFTLEVVRACGVLLRVADGETALPWPDAVDASLTPLTGSDGMREHTWNEDHVRIRVSGPGRYRISLDDVPGYLPVTGEEVEIPPESFVEHVVHLVRKP